MRELSMIELGLVRQEAGLYVADVKDSAGIVEGQCDYHPTTGRSNILLIKGPRTAHQTMNLSPGLSYRGFHDRLRAEAKSLLSSNPWPR